MILTPSLAIAVISEFERPGIDHDPIADHRQLAPDDTRGQQGKLVGLAVYDERVPGIMPALEAHHDIGALGKPIDDLAFAFVAPLRADNYHICHFNPRMLLSQRH